MPTYPKYKITFHKGEVFKATVTNLTHDGVSTVKLPNTSVTAIIEGDIRVNDTLYLIVLNEKPLRLSPHSVLLSNQEKRNIPQQRISQIKRILNLSGLQDIDMIIQESSKVSQRIVKSSCIEISDVFTKLDINETEEAIYIMNLMADAKIPISPSSYSTVSVLFESQNTILSNILKALEFLVDSGHIDSRITKNEEGKYNTNVQFLLDYHSKAGIYNMLISNDLIDQRFQRALRYFDGLLYWNSIATVNSSPLIVPLVITDHRTVYGIRLIHLWFNKLKSKSSFLFNDLFRLKADMEGDKIKVTYDNSDLALDIENLDSKMEEYGYRLQGYNLDKTLIFLDRNRTLNPLSSHTTFVV